MQINFHSNESGVRVGDDEINEELRKHSSDTQLKAVGWTLDTYM